MKLSAPGLITRPKSAECGLASAEASRRRGLRRDGLGPAAGPFRDPTDGAVVQEMVGDELDITRGAVTTTRSSAGPDDRGGEGWPAEIERGCRQLSDLFEGRGNGIRALRNQ